MKLSTPKNITFYISIVLAVIALIWLFCCIDERLCTLAITDCLCSNGCGQLVRRNLAAFFS